MKKSSTSTSWLNLTVLLVGEISTVLGLVVILEWSTRNLGLLQMLPALVPFKYNAALGFILCGIGLISIAFGRARLAMASGIAAAIGLVVVYFGIDQPRSELLGQAQSSLSEATLVVGLLMALLLALAVHFARTARLRAIEAEAAKQEMEKQISERKRAEEQIQRNLKRIRALHEIQMAITSTLDLRGVLDLLLEKIDMLLPYSAATVRLLNQESGESEPVACRNLDEKEWRAEQWKDEQGIPNVAFENKTLWIVSNVQTDPRTRDPEFFRRNGLVSYLGVPLIAKGEILGVLGFYTKENYQFADEEVEFLTTLASQAATAIQNSWFYEETKASKRELEKALQVKSAFLDTMSHELRTPLNIIIGNSGIIKDQLCGSINSEQERRLAAIEHSTAELLRMIQSILDISCLEKGAIPLCLEEVNIGGLLSEVRSEFFDLSQKKGVRLEVQGNGLNGPMLSDRMKLKEILYNLIGNAMKFTREGKVEVRGRHLKEKDQVELLVQDSGIGIQEEDLSHIFDVFYQVDSSNQREFGGTGLGLNIVKRLVELLQGEIRVESEFGKGSTFHVILPREISVSDLS